MLTVGTTFSGIGAPEQALKNIKMPHKVLWACDNDKFVKITYKANHKCKKWYNDITALDINNLAKVDLYVFGFPCQSISIAGNMNLEDGRTALVSYSLDIIDKLAPKYILFENVKNLVSKTFVFFFDQIKERIEKNYVFDYKILNSKNFGVPHHRERVFGLGIRKDLNCNPVFPTGSTKISTLDKVLCTNVDAKYYLSTQAKMRLINIEKRAIKNGLGYSSCIITPHDIYKNLDASYHKGPDGKRAVVNDGNLRMLTPRECARIQGFPDDFKIPVSNMQAYKQFGNTITVSVLEEIFKLNLKG